MSDHDDFGAFLVGFLVGGVSGAITALLLAPQSGEETRTMIKDRSIELRDQASATVEESLDKAEKSRQLTRLRKRKRCLNRLKPKRLKSPEQGQVVLEDTKAKAAKTVKSATKGDKGEASPKA